MYAVFEDGSRQYRAEVGSTITLDYRAVEVGKTLELDKVLLVENGGTATIGQPLVAGAKVVAEVVDLPRVKSVIQKFRRRKNYRRLKGHTQPFVKVKVTQIVTA
jgi:large subunit ribosomal protein L21